MACKSEKREDFRSTTFAFLMLVRRSMTSENKSVGLSGLECLGDSHLRVRFTEFVC